jgi:hypothetical protein
VLYIVSGDRTLTAVNVVTGRPDVLNINFKIAPRQLCFVSLIIEVQVNQIHQQISRTIGTDAGKCALWQTEHFESTGDPDDWDDWLRIPGS